MNILEVINVSREVTWLPWAVQYFFLIGISVGCFIMSLPGLVLGATDERRLAHLALIGALVCGLVAPVALLADLHQPGRFWHFYAHPNLGSWMAWGAFFIPVYVAALVVYAWMTLKPVLAAGGDGDDTLSRLRRVLGGNGHADPRFVQGVAIVTAIFGALVLLYTGMEVMVVRARPLWNTPLLPLQFVATAITGAAGLVLVLDRVVAGRDGAAQLRAARWMSTSLAATIAIGIAWLAIAALGLERMHAQALASVAGHTHWQVTALWAALATIVPLGIILLRPRGLGWLVGLLGLHAAWMFRWTVFIGGQSVPKNGAGLYDYSLPLGHDGLLGILGTVGLWVVVFIIVSWLVPAQTPRANATLHAAE